MAIYGVNVKKSGPYDDSHQNTYYLAAFDIVAARNMSEQLWQFERAIFGSLSEIRSVHVWEVNPNPQQFLNYQVSEYGQVPTPTPNPPQMCLKVTWSTENGYPGYKMYRVCVNDDIINGRTWSVAYLNTVATALSAFSIGTLPLVTRKGKELSNPVVDPVVQFMQLTKKWYNRGS